MSSSYWLAGFVLIPRTTLWFAFITNSYEPSKPPYLFWEIVICVTVAQVLITWDLYTWYRLRFKEFHKFCKEYARPDDGCSN